MPGTSNFLSSDHKCSDCLHPIEYVIWTWNFVKDRWRTLNDARPKWVQVGCSNYLKRTATSQVQIWSPIANGPCSVCIVIHSIIVLQVQHEMTSTNTFIDITRYMPSTPPPPPPTTAGMQYLPILWLECFIRQHDSGDLVIATPATRNGSDQ